MISEWITATPRSNVASSGATESDDLPFSINVSTGSGPRVSVIIKPSFTIGTLRRTIAATLRASGSPGFYPTTLIHQVCACAYLKVS